MTVNLDVQGDAPWQKIVAAAIVGTAQQAQALEHGSIVEGELVEDDA